MALQSCKKVKNNATASKKKNPRLFIKTIQQYYQRNIEDDSKVDLILCILAFNLMRSSAFPHLFVKEKVSSWLSWFSLLSILVYRNSFT